MEKLLYRPATLVVECESLSENIQGYQKDDSKMSPERTTKPKQNRALIFLAGLLLTAALLGFGSRWVVELNCASAQANIACVTHEGGTPHTLHSPAVCGLFMLMTMGGLTLMGVMLTLADYPTKLLLSGWVTPPSLLPPISSN